MRHIYLSFAIMIGLYLPFISKGQSVDTLIDFKSFQLHFKIIRGTGTPILFEAGGGEDARTWSEIVKQIAEITGTTLIMYDRAGFGQSTIDSNKHGIMNGMIALESALKKLGYDKDIILVAHSQGGLYATLFAARNAGKVKGAVMIDATTACFYEPTRLAVTQAMIDKQNSPDRRISNPGAYYQGADFSSNINLIRNTSFPIKIPVIDLVSDRTPFSDIKEKEDWKQCHLEFARNSPNRVGILAYNTGHFIFESNGPLVVIAIAKTFERTTVGNRKVGVLERIATYSMHIANDLMKKEKG